MAGERSRLLWAGLAASLVLQLLTLAVLVGHIREHHAPADDWAQAVARPHSRRRLLQETAAQQHARRLLAAVPDGLLSFDPQSGRLVISAHVLVQPDQAAVNAAAGAAVFDASQPVLLVSPAVNSSSGGPAPPGSDAAPAISTTGASQPVVFSGPARAAALDVGAGVVSGATIQASGVDGVVRGATLTGTIISAPGGAVTAATVTADSIQTTEGGSIAALGPGASITATAGSVVATSVTATGQLAGQALLVQEAARVRGSLRVTGQCTATGGYTGSTMALTSSFKALACSCLRYSPWNPYFSATAAAEAEAAGAASTAGNGTEAT